MAKLKLSFITANNERIQPLIDGEVEPEGIELVHARAVLDQP